MQKDAIVVRLFSNEVATFLFQVVMAQRSYMEWLEGRSYLNVIQISLKNRNHLSSGKMECQTVTLYEHRFLDNKTTNYIPNTNIIGNPTNKTVTMKNLNVSNEGEYVCCVTYSSDSDGNITEIYLIINKAGKPPCPSLNQTLDNIVLIHIDYLFNPMVTTSLFWKAKTCVHVGHVVHSCSFRTTTLYCYPLTCFVSRGPSLPFETSTLSIMNSPCLHSPLANSSGPTIEPGSVGEVKRRTHVWQLFVLLF